MADDRRVVTANLPGELVSRLDVIAARIDRSRSWIVRQALGEWLDEEQRRHDLTLEALASLDAGAGTHPRGSQRTCCPAKGGSAQQGLKAEPPFYAERAFPFRAERESSIARLQNGAREDQFEMAND